MAKYRRSKTDERMFEDIPKTKKKRKYKEQDPDQIEDED